jgi:hypothetical protein
MKFLLYVLLSAVIAAFMYWGYQAAQDEPLNVPQLVQDWNIELALPTVDSGTTRVDELTIVGRSIVVNYHLMDYQGFNLDDAAKPALRQSVQRMFCVFFIRDETFARQFEQNQLSIEAKYFNANDLILTRIRFDPAQCAGIYATPVQPSASTAATAHTNSPNSGANP